MGRTENAGIVKYHPFPSLLLMLMREEKEVKDKIKEVETSNKRKLRPSPERIDIISGLNAVLEKGKYGTLHDWEAKKKELKRLENEIGKDKTLFRFLRRGVHGEIFPDYRMDSIAWKMSAYSWALKIKDPVEVTLTMSQFNTKKKEKKKEKA